MSEDDRKKAYQDMIDKLKLVAKKCLEGAKKMAKPEQAKILKDKAIENMSQAESLKSAMDNPWSPPPRIVNKTQVEIPQSFDDFHRD